MPPKGVKVVAANRRARRDYELEDTFECGIVLRGSEVKSLRESKVQLADAYARPEDGEVWLVGLHIAPYSHAAGVEELDPDRPRKLLLHRREIDRIAALRLAALAAPNLASLGGSEPNLMAPPRRRLPEG